ncbi:MAG: hypothetical protein M1113_04050 [Candidatus Thermoplasmatota archaeon]|nr:hypothetical protein [Candidatus Thermoplasmatota archaeon]
MKIEVGQRFDFEIDREDVVGTDKGPIIATWYHLGNSIYVELALTKSLADEIRSYFISNSSKTALLSITRVSKTKYIVSPTVVLLNRKTKDLKQIK